MGHATGISWTDHTWNPFMGCDKVSPGCDNCYMFREQKRYGHDPAVVRRSKTKFREPLKWKEPARVFTCSWGDFFHADADSWRDEAWDIIRATPHLTYQILTKRPSRIARHLPYAWGDGWHNVWLGVSVETQEWAERRIPVLLNVPAAVHFVSAEPLLGPLDLRTYLGPWMVIDPSVVKVLEADPGIVDRITVPTTFKQKFYIDWVIVGGESDPADPRPMAYGWARDILTDCRERGSAFFFKQRSDYRPSQLAGVPEDLLVHEFPDDPRDY